MTGPFARLWLARLVSSLGTEVSGLALPLLAVVGLGAGPFAVAVLTAAGYLPSVLLGLAAGSIVDRFDRRLLVVGADVARGLVLLIVPIGWVAGFLSIGVLAAVAFVVGVGTLVFDVAVQSLTPGILEAQRLVAGNARLQLAEQGAGLVGPALGGVLVAIVTAPFAVLVDAVSYVASAGLLFGLPPSKPEPSRGAAGAVDGIRYLARHPILRATASASCLINLGGRAIEALLVISLVRIGGLDPAAIGLVFSAGAAGFVVGALVTDRIVARLGVGRSIVSALVVVILTFLAMAIAPAAVYGYVIGAAFFVYGVAAVTSSVAGLSLRQAVTEPAMLGRVSAAVRVVVYAAFPIGALGGGLIASVFDLRAAFVVATLVASLALVPLLLSPVRGVRALSAAPA